MCMRNLTYMLAALNPGVQGAVWLGDPPGLSPVDPLGLLTKSLWEGQHGWPSQERDPSITIPTPPFLLSETEREVLFFLFLNFLVCGILSHQGLNSHPLQWKCGVLTTGLPGSPSDSALVF